jgi:hypothetical protein
MWLLLEPQQKQLGKETTEYGTAPCLACLQRSSAHHVVAKTGQSGGYLPDIKKISNQASSNSNSLGIMKIFLRFLGENM